MSNIIFKNTNLLHGKNEQGGGVRSSKSDVYVLALSEYIMIFIIFNSSNKIPATANKERVVNK